VWPFRVCPPLRVLGLRGLVTGKHDPNLRTEMRPSKEGKGLAVARSHAFCHANSGRFPPKKEGQKYRLLRLQVNRQNHRASERARRTHKFCLAARHAAVMESRPSEDPPFIVVLLDRGMAAAGWHVAPPPFLPASRKRPMEMPSCKKMSPACHPSKVGLPSDALSQRGVCLPAPKTENAANRWCLSVALRKGAKYIYLACEQL